MAQGNGGRPFRIEVTTLALGQAAITVRGELDLFTAPRLHDALAQSIELGARRVVVDLARVTFIDSTALGVLIGVGKELRAGEGSLDIVCQNGNVRRVLELTGLDAVFAVHATLTGALDDAPHD
ncbi:MAG TPA: STAS domain-containing protein [Thermoleophilia bacterium]|nr:STAS domain-containing protein [Thermoleophilia bacterium]